MNRSWRCVMGNTLKGKIKLIVFILFILLSTDSALVSTNNNRIWARISWLIIGTYFLCRFMLKKRIQMEIKEILYLIVFSGCIILTMSFANRAFHINYIQRILLLWLSALIVKDISYGIFMDMFVYVMEIIAIFSLVCFAMQGVIVNLPFVPNLYAGDVYFKALFLTNVPCFGDVRNYGPFWEPGAYQLYLNWAIFYELQRGKGPDIIKVAIFAVTIFTTKSTTGMIILGLLFIYYLVIDKHSNTIRSLTTKCLVLAGTFSGVLYLSLNKSFFGNVFNKLILFVADPRVNNSATVSAYVRFHGIEANIKELLNSPFWGNGITILSERFLQYYELTSNPNGILAMGATFGVLPFCLYMMLIIASANKQRKMITKGIILLILVIMFATENLIVSLSSFTLLFYESGIIRNWRDGIFGRKIGEEYEI